MDNQGKGSKILIWLKGITADSEINRVPNFICSANSKNSGDSRIAPVRLGNPVRRAIPESSVGALEIGTIFEYLISTI